MYICVVPFAVLIHHFLLSGSLHHYRLHVALELLAFFLLQSHHFLCSHIINKDTKNQILREKISKLRLKT